MKKETYNNNMHICEQTVSELAASVDEPAADVNLLHYKDACRELNYTAKRGTPHFEERKKWRGGIGTWDEARSILDNGWVEGAERAMALRDEVMAEAENLPKVRRRKRRQVWSDEGQTLDVDRAIAGQWDVAWRSTKNEMVQGNQRCVTLNVNWGGNCDQKAEELFWSGAVMMALSDILQTAGYNVQLNAVCCSNLHWGSSAINKIIIKGHTEPMRPDALAGIVCHAGIFRSFGFKAICNVPFNVGMGLGMCISWREMQRKLAPLEERVFEFFDPNDIVVEGAYNKQSAIREITKTLTRFA